MKLASATPAGRARAARLGIIISVVVFVLGLFLACTCPGWFVMAGIFAVAAVLWGKPLVRLIGLALATLSFASAVTQFQQERARDAALQQALEAHKQTKISGN